MHVLQLSDEHDRLGFDCGNPDLNEWLRTTARQHKLKALSSTFIATEDQNSTCILGYYCVTLAEMANDDLPDVMRKRYPRRMPVFRLGRLAVSLEFQGRSIGATLLMDAIHRCEAVSRQVGGVGVMVNAKPQAIPFYTQYGFEQMLDHPLNLFRPFQLPR